MIVVHQPPAARRHEQEQGDEGAAAVEFALVLPVLVAFLLVVVAGGMVYLDQLHLQAAARNAARIGSVSPATACDTALGELAPNDVGTPACTVVQDCTTGVVEVRLDAVQTLSIPLLGSRTVSLDATSTFACEP